MIICPRCSFENINSSEFCQECGFDLSKKEYIKPLHKRMEEIDDVIFKPEKKTRPLLKLILILFSVIGVIFILLVAWYAIFPEDETFTDSSYSTPEETTYNNQWKSFTSTEHGFRINFPTDPEAERIPEETLENGITLSGVQYFSSPSEEEIYLIEVADYDITPSNYDNNLGLEGAVSAMASGTDAKLTSSSFTQFKSYDAIKFTLSTVDDYYGKGIAFIKDDLRYVKMYLMMVVNNTKDFSNLDSFTSSFEFR